MIDFRSEIGSAMLTAAGTLPIWRDTVVTILALLVIGTLYFVVET